MELTALEDLPRARLAAISLILSDMDGTWLGADHHPTPGGLQAIREAEAAGYVFAFATGRCPASAQGASGLDLSGRPGIYSNGAVVRGKGGTNLYTLDLGADVLAPLMELVASADAGVTMLRNDRDRFYVPDAGLPMALHLHDEYGDPAPIEGTPERCQLAHLVGAPGAVDRIELRVRAAVGRLAAVARNLPTDLVVSCADATKGVAAQRLCAHLGMEIGGVVAIGDSANDAPMLRAAGVGVVVANGRPAAREAAECVTCFGNVDPDQGRHKDKVGMVGVLETVRAIVAATAFYVPWHGHVEHELTSEELTSEESADD